MAKAKAKKNTLLRVSVILFLLYVVISLVQIQVSRKTGNSWQRWNSRMRSSALPIKSWNGFFRTAPKKSISNGLPGNSWDLPIRKNRCWWIFPAVDSKDYRRMQTECSSWLWGIL